MSLTGMLAAFTLRITYCEGERVVAWIDERFTDHSLPLPRALAFANDKSWDTVRLALAGEGLRENVKDLFRDRDQTALRDQIRAFIKQTPTGLEMSPDGLRVRACEELNRLRKSNRLAPAHDRQTLSRDLRRYGDPSKLAAGAEAAVAAAADALAADAPHLAQVLRLTPPGETPLLASAFLFFFRREVAQNPELSTQLTFDSLRALTVKQEAGFALLDTRTGGLLDQFDVMFDALGNWFTSADGKLDAIASKLDRLLDERERSSRIAEPFPSPAQTPTIVLMTGVNGGESGAIASAAAAPTVITTVPNAGRPAVAGSLPMIDSREVARREQQRWVQHLNRDASWTNEFGIRFRLIPPGRFRMGAVTGDPHASSNEKPAQTIAISIPLYVATIPITNGTIRHFLEAASSEDGPDVKRLLQDRAFAYSCRSSEVSDDLPAVEISAPDALVLCRWMNQRDRRHYRLPTEAEWEYLARAGVSGMYWWEEGLAASQRAVFGTKGPLAPSERRANIWGLSDVLGNVAEWTGSEYSALDSGHSSKPASSCAGTLTVRGGSWRDTLEQLRLSRRLSMNGAARKDWLGVRLVCEV